MVSLVDLARRFLSRTSQGEKGDKGEKPAPTVPLSPFSPRLVGEGKQSQPVPIETQSVPGAAGSAVRGGQGVGEYGHPSPPDADPLQGINPGDWSATERCEAHRLMHAADTLVERLGVGGHHPEVQAAAAMVTSAYAARDLETVRFTVEEFKVLVRTLGRQASSWRQSSASGESLVTFRSCS